MSVEQYFFTFGSDHLDSEGQSLAKKYVIIPAFEEDEARKVMFSIRGGAWAFVYDAELGHSLVDKYDLERVDISQVTLASYVDSDAERCACGKPLTGCADAYIHQSKGF